MSEAAALRARLAAMDGEITRQTRFLDELKAARASVQSQLDHNVYPVLTLPPEITSEIFSYCLPPGNARVMRSQAPFLLLNICRQWREIALSTPRLWATLDIDVVKLGRQIPDRWVGLAAGWLRRAGNHPLSVTLRHPLDDKDPTEDMFQPDLAFLRQISRRLESLEVYGLEQERQENNWFRLPLDFTPASFPLLRRLTFGPAQRGTSLEDFWLGFFSDAPQLRELALLGEVTLESSPLPWQHLTKFVGCDLQRDDCVELFRLAPELKECSLGIQIPSTTISSPPIIHPNLKSLHILPDSDGDCWTDILSFLTLPNLETLTFGGMSDPDTAMFEAFLSRSSASLRNFSVSPDRWADFGNWERCFRLMPDLERLHLSCQDPDFQIEFVEAFSTNEDQPLLLPRLRHLNLFRTSMRLAEIHAAVTERKLADPDGLLSSVCVLWPVEGGPGGMQAVQILNSRT